MLFKRTCPLGIEQGVDDDVQLINLLESCCDPPLAEATLCKQRASHDLLLDLLHCKIHPDSKFSQTSKLNSVAKAWKMKVQVPTALLIKQ